MAVGVLCIGTVVAPRATAQDKPGRRDLDVARRLEGFEQAAGAYAIERGSDPPARLAMPPPRFRLRAVTVGVAGEILVDLCLLAPPFPIGNPGRA
jgi:hypothetical protein